jgi:sulfite exporter TauE/SafE
MGMDIRLPIGLLFSAIGLLLTAFGAFSNHEIYQASLGINVNIIWGLVLLAFGFVMLFFGRSASVVTNHKVAEHAATSAKRSEA